VCLRLVSSIPPLKHGEIVCFNRTRGWLVAKPHIRKWWSCDMRIANWYENMKLIWKYETDMKISNVHVGTIHRRWEYETDMKIWNWYENMKLIWKYETAQFDILTFLCIVPTWMFDMFILDAAGMKIHLARIKTRSQRKNGWTSSYVDVCTLLRHAIKPTKHQT
jgi:hypothetical protein